MIFRNVKLDNELFNPEELIRIKHALLHGEFSKLMNVLDDITPEKEQAMQTFINELTPVDDNFESLVRKQMAKELPNGPQSPEEEELWEKRLQAEFNEHEARINKRRRNIADGLAGKEVPADNEAIDAEMKDQGVEDDEDIEAEDNSTDEIPEKKEIIEPERKTAIKEIDPKELEEAKERMKNPELEKDEEGGEDEEEGLTGMKFEKPKAKRK